jgi:hypothetical protein
MRERRIVLIFGLATAAIVGAVAITDPRGTPHAWPAPVDWAGIILIGLMMVLVMLPPWP